MGDALLLYFDDEADAALRLARAAGLDAMAIGRHRFPDGELKLTLPASLPPHIVLFRSLAQPNEKLVELLLVAQSARQHGAAQLTLVCPYLAYMRQDIAFNPGEVVSQKIVGRFLASLFDGVITVDPHLHRVATLDEAVPAGRAIALSAAPLLGEQAAAQVPGALLLGPDAESAQWVAAAALAHGLDHAVCDKVRHGDHHVTVQLPPVDFHGRAVVLLDDVASSGHTLAEAARGALATGAASVDVAVTHALFADGALALVRDAGVRHIWSTDSIAHESNVVHLAEMLARALA